MAHRICYYWILIGCVFTAVSGHPPISTTSRILDVVVSDDGATGYFLSNHTIEAVQWADSMEGLRTETLSLNVRSTITDPSFIRDGYKAIAPHPSEGLMVAWFGIRSDRKAETYLTFFDSKHTVQIQQPISVFAIAAGAGGKVFVSGIMPEGVHLIHEVSPDGFLLNSFHPAQLSPPREELLGNIRLLTDGSSLYLIVLRAGKVFQYDYFGNLVRSYDFEEFRGAAGERISIESAFSRPNGIYLDLRLGEAVAKSSGGFTMVNPRRVLILLADGKLESVPVGLAVHYAILGTIPGNKLIVKSLEHGTHGQLSILDWQ